MKRIVGVEKRKIAVEILTAARRRVERRHEAWVCCAINDVSNIEEIKSMNRRYPKSQLREHVGVLLKEEIQRRLGTCTFVTTWLRQQPGVDCDQVDSYENARLYRMRWIDSMIAELSDD
jgi:hypothetical protein